MEHLSFVECLFEHRCYGMDRVSLPITVSILASICGKYNADAKIQPSSYPRHTTCPSNTVISTCVARIAIGSARKMSCESTAKSATLPGAMLPR